MHNKVFSILIALILLCPLAEARTKWVKYEITGDYSSDTQVVKEVEIDRSKIVKKPVRVKDK